MQETRGTPSVWHSLCGVIPEVNSNIPVVTSQHCWAGLGSASKGYCQVHCYWRLLSPGVKNKALTALDEKYISGENVVFLCI